jgi:hypothetical protein
MTEIGHHLRSCGVYIIIWLMCFTIHFGVGQLAGGV